MTIFQAAVLGVVQGVTEFLPVSSSGHLVLVPALLGWNVGSLAFDAAVNAGTVAAVAVALRGDIGRMWRGLRRPKTDAWGRLGWIILAATVPAALAGCLFKDAVEQYARVPTVVAGSLALWGILLFIADRLRPAGEGDVSKTGWKRALAIGAAQALALVPGTSRSGVTITAGLFAGLDRQAAARFSFLLGLPLLALVSVYGVWNVLQGGAGAGAGTGVSAAALAVGILASFLSGLWAIRFLLALLKKRVSYAGFAFYRVALALVVLFVL